MTWIYQRFLITSECGRYAIEGRYIEGHFEWRGRFVQTDELIQASHDRDYVEKQCEAHAARLGVEAA